MPTTQLKVNGSIINELSDKIPTNIVAINELIKNAYDAGATKVTVDVDIAKRKMVIDDNGCGMNDKDITDLFHISHSNKSFGTIKHGRYIQGSKGLGFLSVFRFGNIVTWYTNKSGKGLKFTVDKNDLIVQANLSDYIVNLENDSTIAAGTRIEIQMEGTNLDSMIEDLKEEKIVHKITHSFIDTYDSKIDNPGLQKRKPFSIELIVNGKSYKSTAKPILPSDIQSRKMFVIEYNSKDQKIVFSHQGQKIDSIDCEFAGTDYSCSIYLEAFKLQSYDVAKFPALYKNPTLVTDEITPLVYVNKNLFNNYELFDPNINRKKQNAQTLPQLIGKIEIISDSTELIFNSDRSQFAQNTLTDQIRHFLQQINKIIQAAGGKRKKYFPDLNFVQPTVITADNLNDKSAIEKLAKQHIADDFIYRDDVTITYNKSAKEVVYSYLNIQRKVSVQKSKKETPTQSSSGPILSISRERIDYPLYGDPIELEKYIQQAQYSNGDEVGSKNVNIIVNGVQLRIISSVDKACEKEIIYSFEDKIVNTEIKKRMVIEFAEPNSGVSGNEGIPFLINYPGITTYKVTFINSIPALVNQINNLYQIHGQDYRHLIACSLRTLFELSLDAIKSYSGTCSEIISFRDKLLEKNKDKSDLRRDVKETVYFVKNGEISLPGKNKQKLLSVISSSSKIRYHTLNNKLIVQEYVDAVGKANLATHKSADQISMKDIEDLGSKIGCFLVAINEMMML